MYNIPLSEKLEGISYVLSAHGMKRSARKPTTAKSDSGSTQLASQSRHSWYCLFKSRWAVLSKNDRDIYRSSDVLSVD